MPRALRVFTLVVASTVFAQVADVRAAHAFDAGAEAEFVTRINALRTGLGAPALSLDAGLTRVARDWTTEMANGVGLAHNPALRSIMDSITATGRKMGENVAYGGAVAGIHERLVHSSKHYANLINPDFRAIGVGVLVKNGQMWVTQDFLSGPTGAGMPATRTMPPRPTTTTVDPPPRPRPVAAAAPRPPAPPPPTVALAPPPAPTPPVAPPAPPPWPPERLRIALATEQLLERSLRPLLAPGTRSRAR